MQLFIIRHAQSVNNEIYARTGGSKGRLPDPPLTDVGWRQATRLANHLARPVDFGQPDPLNHKGFELTHLYCSLMQRAVETGTAVAEAIGLPLVAWEEIHEYGGIFEEAAESGKRIGLPGPNRAYFEANFPHLTLPETLGDEGWWNRPVEPREQALVRAESFVRGLLARHGDCDDQVAIVTHGGFAYGLMHALFGFQPVNTRYEKEVDVWFKFNNSSITRVDIDRRGISLAYQNRVDHLTPDLLSF